MFGSNAVPPGKKTTNLPLFMDRLALSLFGLMVWEEWMNVAICVGDIEMLDKAPSGLQSQAIHVDNMPLVH